MLLSTPSMSNQFAHSTCRARNVKQSLRRIWHIFYGGQAYSDSWTLHEVGVTWARHVESMIGKTAGAAWQLNRATEALKTKLTIW